jgi:hypothetical protein
VRRKNRSGKHRENGRNGNKIKDRDTGETGMKNGTEVREEVEEWN